MKKEEWYVVNDGGTYNVFSRDMMLEYENEIGWDQVEKVFHDMDKAFDYAEEMNRREEERSQGFSPSRGYFNEEVNESKTKRHNAPRDKGAAMRKGNRDAEREMLGNGFKSKDRIHGVKGYDRREGKKVNLNYNEMDENVVRLVGKKLAEMIQEAVLDALKSGLR